MERKILPFTAASPATHPVPERFTIGDDEARRRLSSVRDHLRLAALEIRSIADARANGEPIFAEALQREPYRPSTLDRILEALGDSRAFYLFIGFYCGCMATVGLAFLWSRA